VIHVFLHKLIYNQGIRHIHYSTRTRLKCISIIKRRVEYYFQPEMINSLINYNVINYNILIMLTIIPSYKIYYIKTISYDFCNMRTISVYKISMLGKHRAVHVRPGADIHLEDVEAKPLQVHVLGHVEVGLDVRRGEQTPDTCLRVVVHRNPDINI